MSGALACEVFYHPDHPVDTGAAGAACHAVDVTADAATAARLAGLGIEVPADLPAVLLTSGDGRLRLQGLRLSAAEVAELAAGRGWRPRSLTAYTASWCSDCRRLKRLVGEAGLDCAEVDIENQAAAEAEVLRRSGGRRVVPTLVIDGRVWAFNPEPPLLRRLIAG
jgi:glutaredoxin